MHGARRILELVVFTWELAQVELHGRVSVEHIQKLRWFLDKTSFTKAAAACVIFPLPSVITLAALEAIPLAPLKAGTFANYAFWIRHVATLAVLAPGILSIFQTPLPELNITRRTVMILGIVGSIGSGGFAFVVSLVIGFPVPFTLLVSAPAWLLVVIPPLISIYLSRLRHNPALLRRFIRCWFVVVWLAVSVVLYPTYVFGFHRLGPTGQVIYVGLLPVLKITGRNIISWLIGDRDDVKPEIVIFNIEVFSALYMSVALQNSAKLSTTFAVIAVDIIQSKVAINDINKMMRGIDQILLSTGPRRSTFRHVVFNPKDQNPTENSVEQSSAQSNAILAGEIKPFTAAATMKGPSQTLIKPSVLNSNAARVHPTSGPSENILEENRGRSDVVESRPVAATEKAVPASSIPKKSRSNQLSPKDQKYLAVRSAQVLFTAEFVLLVKYVEAIVPAIYAAFVVFAFNFGHREYYSQLDSITPRNLNNTILNVMLYWLLKSLSFYIMCFIISRKLGMSAAHLVAFVLIHQWEAIFSKLLTWVVYTTLTSLKHSGPDFTFKFPWLHKTA